MAAQLPRFDLIVLDELGYLPFARPGGQLLFHHISKLYERTSFIIATNRAFGEWPPVFRDPDMTKARFDRITRHSDTVEIGDDSWRFEKPQPTATRRHQESIFARSLTNKHHIQKGNPSPTRDGASL